jgi:hypothetical protein
VRNTANPGNCHDRSSTPSEDSFGAQPPTDQSKQASSSGKQAGYSEAGQSHIGEQTNRAGDQKEDSPSNSEGQSSSRIPTSVEHLVAELRRTSDIGLLYDNIPTVAELSDAEVAVVYQVLKEILGRKLNQTDFRKAVREARARQRRADAETANQRRLTAGHPYRIRGGCMVHVEETNGVQLF